MEPTPQVSGPLNVRRPTRDPQGNRGGHGEEFAREFEKNEGEHDAVEKHDKRRARPLQFDPPIRRKSPSQGDGHIDIVV